MLKPNYEGNEYEVWVVAPVRVGTVIRHAEKDLQVEGSNFHFKNIESAVEYMNPKLFTELGIRVPKDDVIRLTGFDLATTSDWQMFCELREINERKFLSNQDKAYDVSREELEQISYNPSKKIKAREMPPPPSKAPQILRRQK